MASRKKSLVYEHYEQKAEGENKLKCKYCDSKISCIVHSLQKHLKHRHNEEYQSLMMAKYVKLKKESENPQPKKLKKRIKFCKESVVMSHCIALVVHCSQPFSIFDDSSMKALITLAKRGANEQIEITSETVRKALRNSESVDIATVHKLGAWESDAEADDDKDDSMSSTKDMGDDKGSDFEPPLCFVIPKLERTDDDPISFSGSSHSNPSPAKKQKLTKDSNETSVSGEKCETKGNDKTASALLTLADTISTLTTTLCHYIHNQN